MPDKNHLVGQYSNLADDFFMDLVFLKVNDIQNTTIPFIYAHTLEISAKTACFYSDIWDGVKGHDIRKVLELLKTKIPEVADYLPSGADFTEYKQFWKPTSQSDNAVIMPQPKDFDRLELAYFIDNCANLKYGFNLEHEQISAVHVATDDINFEFVKLFKICRDVYCSDSLNDRLRSKLGEKISEQNQFISPVIKYLSK